MILGLSTYSFPWHIEYATDKACILKDLIMYAASENILCFQIGDNCPLHSFDDAVLDHILTIADENGISLQVGMRGLKPGNIIQYLQIAKKLRSPFLRVVIDDIDFHPSVEEIIDIIKGLLFHLEREGIVLTIENHDRFPAKSLEYIIKQTSTRWVGICLDTCNSIGAGEGINELLPVLLPYTVNLHIKDFNIERVEHKMGFIVTGTAAGEGMLHIPELLKECSKYPRCTTATLELWIGPETHDMSTLEKEKQLVQKSINYLKNYIQ